MTKGATKAGLGLDNIKNFPVQLAPLEEQKKIVQEIEGRLSVAAKLEETMVTSLQQAETLRQSILKKAFEGGLVNRTDRFKSKLHSNYNNGKLFL